MHRITAVIIASFTVTACDCRGNHLISRPDAGCPPEVCDGLDNDCNGEVDDLPELTCGLGICTQAVPACTAGVEQTSCTPGPSAPEKCNQLDDDCDGTVDEDGVCDAKLMCPASVHSPVGVPVTLSGSAVGPTGPVSVVWSVTEAPAGSTAMPAPNYLATTRFTPDVMGTFTLKMCTIGESPVCCTTTVDTLQTCTNPPAPPASTACQTSWDGRPIVQFAPVPQGFEYQLLDSSGMLLGTASEGHNHLRPAARITTGLAPPGQKVSLGLRACATSDGTCCSTLTPLDVMVVSVCQSPVAPSSTNVVLSEYVTNGEGACPSPDCATMDTCQAGEAVEITNLSNCPVTLDGYHFAYRNSNASTASYRWMNFGSADVIPPRGVYVAIRNRQYAPACAAPLGAESNGLYGLKISRLSMQGPNLCSGWFNNTGGGMSELQLSPGNISAPELLTFTPSATVARVNPYHPTTGSIPSCSSVGFNAVDSCGSVASGQQPTSVLSPNQLGRLWHPCDAVVNAAPACVRD